MILSRLKKILYKKIKIIFDTYSFNKLNKDKKEIIFYSESLKDWHFFENIIAILINKYNLNICYLTSDLNDNNHLKNNSKFNSFFIGSNFFLILIFHFINSKLLIMTMGDLDNFHIKKNTKSTNPTKYIYLPHQTVSAHMADNKNF